MYVMLFAAAIALIASWLKLGLHTNSCDLGLFYTSHFSYVECNIETIDNEMTNLVYCLNCIRRD